MALGCPLFLVYPLKTIILSPAFQPRSQITSITYRITKQVDENVVIRPQGYLRTMKKGIWKN